MLAGLVWLLGLAAISVSATGQVGGTVETILVLALGIGVCAIAWQFIPFQRFEFDRPNGTFTRTIARVTGKKLQTRALNSIRQAAGQGKWSQGARIERVALLTEDGPYPLEYGYSRSERTEIIRAINDWLDAPKE